MDTKNRCEYCDKELPKGMHTCQEQTGRKCADQREIEMNEIQRENDYVQEYLWGRSRRHE